MGKYKYSVIIPCYDAKESDFRKCLDSVKAQTLQPYEVICIDDCSPIDVPKIALEYDYKYIRNKENLNNGGARNVGVKKSTGDYLVFVNSDDWIPATNLEEIDKVNNGEDCIMIGCETYGSFHEIFIPNDKNTPYMSKLHYNGEPMHIVNRQFWIDNNLWELEHVSVVDVEWVSRLEKYINTYTYTDKAKYMYQVGHPSSIMSKISKGEIESDLDKMLELSKKNAEKENMIIFSHYINRIGGVETAIKNKSKRLDKYYDKSFVYTDRNSNLEQLDLISKHAKIDKNMGQVFNTDICVYDSCWGSYAKCNAKKKIQVLHADYKQIYDTMGWKPSFPADIDLFVSCSKHVQKVAKDFLGIDSVVIYNLLDNEVEIKKPLKCMVLSRITPYKGFMRIIKLVNEIKQRNENIIVYVYTDIVANDSYTIKILEITKDIPEIVFIPARSDVQNHLIDMDYLWLLSDSEGFPYAPYEAFQLGVPCIVTNYGGAEEMIQDGENGYILPFELFETGTIEEWNATIKKITKKIPKDFKFKELSTELDWVKAINNIKNIKNKPLLENSNILLQVLHGYEDLVLKKDLSRGDIIEVTSMRAEELLANPNNLVRIFEGEII